MTRQIERLSIGAFVVLALVGCAMHRPFASSIDENAVWRLSEGCRVYQYGILTDPSCDILTGEGIAIQITRVHLLTLHPGQDNRATIGIGFEPTQGDWQFSSPYADLEIGAGKYLSSSIDQAFVSKRRDKPIFPERLERTQQRYTLPPGEQRFFVLRFPVPQSELRSGFALRVVGLQKDGAVLPTPIIKFN